MDLDPIYYFTTVNDRNVGPVSRAELEMAIRSPGWQPDALIWRDGWTDWKDWRSAVAEIGLGSLATIAPRAESSAPGNAFALQSGQSRSPGNVYSPPAARLQPQDPARFEVVPASFLKRFAAWFIDQLVLYASLVAFVVVLAILAALVAPSSSGSGAPPVAFVAIYIIGVISLYLGYYVLFDSSASGATLGKKALGIRVTDLEGRRIGAGQSMLRTLSCALSYMILYLGFLMALATDRKQALHDLLARTLVIEKDPVAGGGSGSTGAAVAVTIAIIALGLFLIIPILAAIALPAYSDYTHRAAVDMAIRETEPLRIKVHAHRVANGACPEHGADDFGTPESYAGKFHSSVDIETDYETGDGSTCRLRIVMGGRSRNAPDGSLLLQLDEEGRMTCSNETIPRRYLPRSCRSQGPE